MNGITYLSALPGAIPPDEALVHNHVRPTRRLGSRGFRAWLQRPSGHLEPCGCGWAPSLGTHYRVRPSQDYAGRVLRELRTSAV